VLDHICLSCLLEETLLGKIFATRHSERVKQSCNQNDMLNMLSEVDGNSERSTAVYKLFHVIERKLCET